MDPLLFLIIVALGATAVSLVMGLASMTRGAEYDLAHGGNYMLARVGLQGATFALLLLALLLKGF